MDLGPSPYPSLATGRSAVVTRLAARRDAERVELLLPFALERRRTEVAVAGEQKLPEAEANTRRLPRSMWL